MSCKYCGKVKAWIRRKLGISEILTDLGKFYSKYVDDKCKLLADAIVMVQDRQSVLVEAGAQLEKMIGEIERATGAIGHDLNNKSLELGERVRELNARINAINDNTEKLEREVSALQNPGFERIDAVGKILPN